MNFEEVQSVAIDREEGEGAGGGGSLDERSEAREHGRGGMKRLPAVDLTSTPMRTAPDLAERSSEGRKEKAKRSVAPAAREHWVVLVKNWSVLPRSGPERGGLNGGTVKNGIAGLMAGRGDQREQVRIVGGIAKAAELARAGVLQRG